MYWSLYHRYDHASEWTKVARGKLSERKGLSEILFRIWWKERWIWAVIWKTVSLFRDKVEQAVLLVTPNKTKLENVEWDWTWWVLTSIADLVNNLNSQDKPQILVSKKINSFIKGFAISIPFIVSSNSVCGASTFWSNNTSFMWQEHSVFQAKKETALNIVKWWDYTILSGLQEFAILDNKTWITILASDVWRTSKEWENFLRDVIDWKSFTNAEITEKWNKRKITHANFLTENKINDNIRLNVKFNPIKTMGTKQKWEFSHGADKASEKLEKESFGDKASKVMAKANDWVNWVLDGDSPESRREAVFGKYSAKREEVTDIIKSWAYYIAPINWEITIRNSLWIWIKFSEFASSVEEWMNFINETEKNLSKTVSEKPTNILTWWKEKEVDPKTKVAKWTWKWFSHSIDWGWANWWLSISEEDWLLKFWWNVQLSEQTQKLKFEVEWAFSKVVEFWENKAWFLVSMKYSPDDARAIWLTSFKVWDGVISFSASQLRSASEELWTSINNVTTSWWLWYQHFIKVLNFIDSFYTTWVYSSTKDHFGIHEDSTSIVNLIWWKVFSWDLWVRWNFWDRRDTFDLSGWVSHTSFPWSETWIKSKLGWQWSLNLEFLRWLENNYKFYAWVDYDPNSQFSWKIWAWYKEWMTWVWPQVSYDKDKWFVWMLGATIELWWKWQSWYPLKSTTSDFTPSGMFEDPLYKKEEKIKHTREKEIKEKATTAEALPTTPSLTLTDADATGWAAASWYTNALNVAVSVSNGAGVDWWFISESSTAPTTWSTWLWTAPTSFNLSNSDWDHTVYVWVKKWNNISAAWSKTIKLDRVTPSWNSFVWTTPNAKTTQYNNLEINVWENLTNWTITSVTSSTWWTISWSSINSSWNIVFNWLTPWVWGSTLTFAWRDPSWNTFSITKNVVLPN